MRLLSRIATLVATLTPIGAQSWQKVGPADLPSTAAYDIARSRTLLFAGAANGPAETWSWNGAQWAQQRPALQPLSRQAAACAYDLARDRVVMPLFDPTVPATRTTLETWEFDGATWLQASPAAAPPARELFALAYDLLRGRVVLFGGRTGAPGFSVFGDTWEFDGTTWSQVAPGTAPGPRQGAAMAYDLPRGRVVLFGGSAGVAGGFNVFGDTWEFDGQQWTNATPLTSPSARSYATMTFDLVRNRMVLFGGNAAGAAFNDTWEFNGSWRQVATATAPSPRLAFASTMVYDVARQRAVLYGGAGTTSDVWLGDTWEFDGVSWLPRIEAPTPRVFASMVFDRARGRAVLFGGSDGSAYASDTWTVDGTAWHSVQTTTAPPGRAGHASAYDSRSMRTFVFGGVARTTPQLLDDLWAFDGANWSAVAASVRPPARERAAMAHDVARSRLVLFGGANGLTLLGDTWEFDGATWRPVNALQQPPARLLHAMAHDEGRGVTVLFGGSDINNSILGDTWEFDGVDWHQVASAGAAPRKEHAMAYDLHRGRILMCGGRPSPSGTCELLQYDGATWQQVQVPQAPELRLQPMFAYDVDRGTYVMFGGRNFGFGGDTWTLRPFAAAATFARHGIGCVANGLAPTLDAAAGAVPSLGSTFTFALSGLSPNPGASWLVFGFDLQQYQGAPLPIELGALGLPGCLLWNGLDLVQTVAHPNASQANVNVGVPATPSLSGLVVGAQAVTFDSASPNLLGAVSNGAILQLR